MKFISKLNVVVSFSCIVETVNIRKAEKKIKCGLHVSVKCMCSDYSLMRNPICYDLSSLL